MSKLVLVCFRDTTAQLNHQQLEARLSNLSRRITPDNITPRSPRLLSGPGLFLGLINPGSQQSSAHSSAFVGNLVAPETDWWKPGASVPDGSFALFRSDERQVELVSDTCASRTIWYAHTEQMFVAATSQRAIVYFLQSYQPNHQVYSWMLACGGLGYGLSWDSRIKSVPGSGRVVLDRNTWRLTEESRPIEFVADDLSDEGHRKQLERALEENFAALQDDYSDWQLLLSGGFDSRAILLMLKDHKDVTCVTWGLQSALRDKRSDAAIARQLADYYGLRFKYLATDHSEDLEKIGVLFDRLLVAGEGRTDKIAGYADGLLIWKRLFEAGISGVIRGDIGFSPYSVVTPEDVTRSVGINSLSEYSNLSWIAGSELDQQTLPEALEQRQDESLSSWRDRLSYEYRCPVFWAALNEIKASYVEIMNPFLTRRFVASTCRLPDHLRDNKVLFRDIISARGPAIPFADKSATASKTKLLRSPEIVQTLVATLRQPTARALLSDELIEYICSNIKTNGPGDSMRGRRVPMFLKQLVPQKIRAVAVKPKPVQGLDVNLLALRAYIICRMQHMLSEDASAAGVEDLRLTG